MLIKVKTLTGKEIELDIEPMDRVDRIKEKVNFLQLKGKSSKKFTKMHVLGYYSAFLVLKKLQKKAKTFKILNFLQSFNQSISIQNNFYRILPSF